MKTTSRIVKFRQARADRENRSPLGMISLVVTVSVSLLIVFAIAWGTWQYAEIVKGLPAINSLPALVEPVPGALLPPTVLFDWEHQHVILTLQNPASEGRQYLNVNAQGMDGGGTVSKHLVDATISSFDPGFWAEPGFSLSGLTEGTHPTLAQKLVTEVFLSEEPASLKRNIQERLLAMQVTAQYGRQKVLEWFLNAAQYGEFVFGADAAARVYLGKPATQLTVAEAATLTAMAESPDLNPWSSEALLEDHRVGIIEAMLENGVITASDAQAALKETVQLQPQQAAHSLAPDFTNLVLQQLSTEIPFGRLIRGGFEIITTLDYELQKQAECAVRVQLERLQGSPSQSIPEDSLACEAASALPTLSYDNTKSPTSVSANVLILDSAKGEILAWVGGSDGQPTPGLPRTHPAGTILTPFLYLTAFSQGMSPASLVWDLPETGTTTLSSQVLGTYHGAVRLRIAMVNDYGGATAEVLKKVGLDNVLRTEQKFGISTISYTASSDSTQAGLDSQPVSLLETVRAYGVLAEQGMMAGQTMSMASIESGEAGLQPRTILRAVGNDGQVLLDWANEQKQPIVSEQLAYLVTNVLSDDMGQSASLGDPDVQNVGLVRPAPVKTSLSTDGHAAWTIGYIPHLAVGVWMGGSGELKTEMAVGLWHAVMKYAAQQVPEKAFAIPEGISRVEVCDPSGLLPSATCPSRVQEVFLQGSEPTQMDDLYQQFSIDRQTGKLATIFTPEDQVEKRIYLALPPEARLWAEAAGFPMPPDTYDDISLPSPTSLNARFSQPQMFTFVSGKVNIYGNAMSDSFLGYWLEVGQGLNPQRWMYIKENDLQQVQDGLLGTWDTTGLDGNYILILRVDEQSMRFEQAFLVITVDNNPPKVHLLAPLENAQLTMSGREPIVLQAEVSDDHGLARVEFFVDNQPIMTLYTPPFLALWPPEPGDHTLRVVAYDKAGNIHEASTNFSISK